MIRPLHSVTVFFLVALTLSCVACFAQEPVRIWQEPETMPTYLVDPPGLNPRFYNGRAYQGAQGRVYP